jgi:hypothetical protein
MSIPSTRLGDFGGRLVVRPREARRMLDCSNKRLYVLMATGELKSFKDGRARKIIVESIKKYIAYRLLASAKLKRPK